MFNNPTALSALNNLGTYGEVHITANGGSEVFGSANLNDRYACGAPSNPGVATVCAVPKAIKVASSVNPNETGSWAFTFNYAAKLSGQTPAGGGVWNSYPVTGQTTTNAADGTGAGLPYQIVATQVGQTP